MQTPSKFLTIILLILGGLVLYSCKSPNTEPYANKAPITRLSNVPPDSMDGHAYVDTASNPRLTLSWVGDDPDGYVIGYRYRWSYTIGGVVYHHQWGRILNITTVANFALMVDSTITNDSLMYPVYHYFATLPPEGLDEALEDQLAAGETIQVAGVNVFASNPTGARYPVHTNPTSGTFIFDSEDSLNLHTFEVAAIDDHGTPSDRPAFVQFITPRVPPPTTQMVLPVADSADVDHDTVYVSDKPTDTFPGILFSYVATDPNSRTIQYSYSVDSMGWSPFTSSTSTYVNATQFRDPYGARHTFSVRARNEFGSIDTLGYFTRDNGVGFDTIRAKRVFYTLFPYFLRPGYRDTVMVFNASYPWDSTGLVNNSRPSSTMMKDYYSSLLDQITLQDGSHLPYVFSTFRYDGFPSRAKLGHYRVTLIAGDDISEQAKYIRGSLPVFDVSTAQPILHDYAYIGGSLVISSMNMYYAANTGNGDLFSAIFHAVPNYTNFCLIGPDQYAQAIVSPDTSFGGASAIIAGYPEVSLNPVKLDPAWNGGLFKIYTFLPLGFGEYLYSYVATSDSACFQGRPIGIRYQGISFNSIFLGFPLYYVQDNMALAVLKKAFADCQVKIP